MTLISVGYGDIVPQNIVETVVICSILIIGVGLMSYIISTSTTQIINLISTNSVAKVISFYLILLRKKPKISINYQ